VKPIVTYRGVAFPWQCDHMGHMNVMWYVAKFDEATWYLLAAIGFTPTYMRVTRHGMVAVQQNLTYKSELRAGDLIEIRSRAVSIAERKLVFQHEMYGAERDQLCAICEITGVHMSSETRRAVPFPSDVRSRIESLLAGDKE
jgi:acyl-CoA thioester hydrolase